MRVRDTTFVVTDTETTGLSPDSNRVIEIGAVKIRDGSILDRFQQLVNPQQSLSRRITRLTGITTSMVFDAPPMREVMPRYLEFLGPGVFVAHNRSFDQGFLDAELERLGQDTLSNETLCTVRLARRLLPGLDSKGLSRLIEFYNIEVDDRHRALGDAEATGLVLRRLLRQVALEHDVDVLSDLLAFQYRSYQKIRTPPSHLQTIREDVLPNVPESPGVYVLKSRSGASLYVGKAKSLPDRIRSHVTAVESKDGRRREMLKKVRDIEWTETTTELEALLLESRRIKSEKPRYNRAQRRYYRRPFLRLGVEETYPTVSWSRSLNDDGAEYYGPVRNVDQAEMVIDVISRCFRLRECDDRRLELGQRCLYADMDRCTAPCETEDEAEYAAAVERVRAFLKGRDRSVLHRLEKQMQQASDRQEYERAAEFRDARLHIEKLLERQEVVAASVGRRHAALVHQPSYTEDFVVLFVRCGRFIEALYIPAPMSVEGRNRILEQCRTIFDAPIQPDTWESKQVATEIRLVSHWIYAHRDEITVVHWSPERSAEEMVDEIEETVSVRVPTAT